MPFSTRIRGVPLKGDKVRYIYFGAYSTSGRSTIPVIVAGASSGCSISAGR